MANREVRSASGVELRWAKGYAFTSVSPRGVPRVSEYVARQCDRHPESVIANWPNRDTRHFT